MSSAAVQASPLVSVIVTAQDSLVRLKKAVDTVLSQEIVSLELLVIDPELDADIWPWLTSREQDERLKPLKQTEDGHAFFWSSVLQMCRGSWIAFLDASDLWIQGKLVWQLDYHQQYPEVVFSFANYRQVDALGKDYGPGFDTYPRFSRMLKNSICFEVIDTALGYILAEDVVRRSTVMVSKEALQRVCDPELAPQSAGEWNLWLKLCKAGKVAVCREVMVDVDYKRSVQV
ncbi:glycosyltransferase, partial [Magnetococcales bacterium HHB-1]